MAVEVLTEEETKSQKYLISGTNRKVNYATYRQVTGKCETCNSPMDSHPQCEACGVLCGYGHLDGLPVLYRDHNICRHCRLTWKRLERVAKKKISWEIFKDPKPRDLGDWKLRNCNKGEEDWGQSNSPTGFI